MGLVVEGGGAHPFVAGDVGVVGGGDGVEGVFVWHFVHAAGGKGEEEQKQEESHGGSTCFL